jgi:hypothetical protein
MKQDQCFRCASRRCSFRIVTRDLAFDEIACVRHGDALAEYADTVINGMRCNMQSSATVRRGEPYPLEAEAEAVTA